MGRPCNASEDDETLAVPDDLLGVKHQTPPLVTASKPSPRLVFHAQGCCTAVCNAAGLQRRSRKKCLAVTGTKKVAPSAPRSCTHVAAHVTCIQALCCCFRVAASQAMHSVLVCNDHGKILLSRYFEPQTYGYEHDMEFDANNELAPHGSMMRDASKARSSSQAEVLGETRHLWTKGTAERPQVARAKVRLQLA